MNKLQILMPAHNEENSIEDQIVNISKILKEKINFSFLICEDGSEDNTLEILNNLKHKFNIKIISRKNKQGYSNAVISGLKASNADYVLVMDSDGQCDPNEILKFWQERNNSDVVCGWRTDRQDFLYRKFFSDFAKIIYKIFFNVKLKDPSFAFSLMSRKVVENLKYFSPHMPDGFFWEFNARAIYKGFKIKEIGISHKKRKHGNTKIFHFYKLPQIAIINLIGLFKVKLDIIFKKN